MKHLLLQDAKGQDFWAIVHDLMLRDGWYRKVRPINLYTFLGELLVPLSKRRQMFQLCAAIEIKLGGVEYSYRQFRAAFSKSDHPTTREPFIRDYDDALSVTVALDSYLNAVYLVLELVAEANRTVHVGLPRGFRRQAKKWPAFDFKEWHWLPVFYDVRSHLTHYATTIPIFEEGHLFIDFTTAPSEQEFFKREPWMIPLVTIWNLYPRLVDLLDFWALEELKTVPPSEAITIFQQVGPRERPTSHQMTAADVLTILTSLNKPIIHAPPKGSSDR